MANTPKFEIFPTRFGWRWRLVAANGELMNDTYTRKSDCVRAVERTRVLAQIAEVVVKKRNTRKKK